MKTEDDQSPLHAPDLLEMARCMDQFYREGNELLAAVFSTDHTDPDALRQLHLKVSEHARRALWHRERARQAQERRAASIAPAFDAGARVDTYVGEILPASAHTFSMRMDDMEAIDVIIVEGLIRYIDSDGSIEPHLGIVMAHAADGTGWRRTQRGTLSSISADLYHGGLSIRAGEICDAYDAFTKGSPQAFVRILCAWWEAVEREMASKWVHVSWLGRALGPM